MADGAVVVIGGTSGLGREVASHYAGQGRQVVISGRDAARAGPSLLNTYTNPRDRSV
jgi:NAD(P)-dependent dehydrogenase (short-subunit alcohol dehydrogenase family)